MGRSCFPISTTNCKTGDFVYIKPNRDNHIPEYVAYAKVEEIREQSILVVYVAMQGGRIITSDEFQNFFVEPLQELLPQCHRHTVQGKVPREHHSYRWTGEMPCTGEYRCVFCGHVKEFRERSKLEEQP